MNVNDKRIQAYKKTAAGSSENADENTGKTVRKMRTHIDDLMGRDGLLKLVKAGQDDGARHNVVSNVKSETESSGDSVYRRVAKFLLLIGVNEAAKILPHLTDEQTEKIIPEIASIRSVRSDEASVIFAEFRSLLERSRQSGGVQTAFSILEKAFGAQKARQMLEKAVPYPEGVPFDYLQEIEKGRLELLLKDEIVPVQALVLSRLKPALGAAFIKTLDSDRQKELVRRMAKLPSVSTDVVKRVDRAMREKLQNLSAETGAALDGRFALAEILKKMEPSTEKSILSLLGESDPELGEDLRKRLFTIDDILHADDRFIQETLRSMCDENIAVLIAGKNQSFRGKILKNMSKGRGDVVLEEEQLKKPIHKKDSDEITDAFFTCLRRAWENGKLVIRNRDDDVYV